MSDNRSKSYVAIIERETHGFSAFFPDFPICFASGSTIELLKRNAACSLTKYLRVSHAARGLMTDLTIGVTPHNPWAQGIGRMMVCPEAP